jgi:uncharacterized membrane protein YkgB
MSKYTFARIALFIIYAWFGILKVCGVSPASPLVTALLEKTLFFITPHTFLILFGLFEVLIGILFLIPQCKKVALVLFTLHMITTFMPLILVPGATWQGLFIPTLEGQYIIKNLALMSVVIFLSSPK